jgi:hypothetical protein
MRHRRIRGRFSPGLVLASIALIVALGGTATAAGEDHQQGDQERLDPAR